MVGSKRQNSPIISMRIQILDEAERDLKEGFRFYESRGVGLGDYFLDSLISDIDSLQVYAGIHPVVFGFHRMLAQRFPYAIYYILHDTTVKVWAVLDCRKNPLNAQKRLFKGNLKLK